MEAHAMKLLENTFCAWGLPRGGLELCSCSSKENIVHRKENKVPVLCTSAFSFSATLTDVLQQWRHITVSQSISLSSLQLLVLSQMFVKAACMARRLILCGGGTEHTWIQRLTCSLIHIEHVLWISCYWLPQKQSEPLWNRFMSDTELYSKIPLLGLFIWTVSVQNKFLIICYFCSGVIISNFK